MGDNILNQPVFGWLNSSFTRRDFLKNQIKASLYMAAGMSGLILPKTVFSDPVPDIAVAKGSPSAATRAAVEIMGGMKRFVKPGSRVLIKPNMSFPNPPEWATTTNPEVVKELALMCKEVGAKKVLIADYTLFRPDECLKRAGIFDMCDKIEDISVVTVNNERLYRDIDFPGAGIMSQNGVLNDALKADVLIAVPVAKTHTATGVSLSMKGMMGLVWDRSGMHSKGLSSCIVDMCGILKADLTVIDGINVLSTRGPRGPGKVLKENMIIASRDMVAADAYAVSAFEWYGKKYKPAQVEHIRMAHERGLGRMDIENMNVKKVVI